MRKTAVLLCLGAVALWTTRRSTSSRKSNATAARYNANFTAVWAALNGPYTVPGNWDIGGSASVGTTLGVTGTLYANGGLQVTGTMTITESIGAAGEIYANGGLQVPSGQPVVLGGNGFGNLGYLSGLSRIGSVGTSGGTTADNTSAINGLINALRSAGFGT